MGGTCERPVMSRTYEAPYISPVSSKYRQTSSSKSFQVVICLRLVPGLDPGVLFLAYFLWKS